MPVNSDGIIKPIANGDLENWWGPHGTSHLTTVHCEIVGQVQFNRRVAEALAAVWQSIADAGLGHLIDMRDWEDSGGTFCDRRIRGTTDMWSPHAYGCAIDTNTNHVGTMATGQEWIASSGSNFHCDPSLIPPSMHTLAPYFHAWGFSWGGEWNDGSLDPMHNEATDLTCALLEGTALPAEAQAVIDAARAAIGGAGSLGVVRLDATGSFLVPCHPVYNGSIVTVDLRATAEALGATVTWAADGVHVFRGAGEVDTAGWRVTEGDTLRCPLRQLVEGLGWQIQLPLHLGANPPRVYLEKAAPVGG
jgi:hypothetical protein